MLIDINLKNSKDFPRPGVNENKKIHPHKFTLWVAIGSIVMLFAGLTSAYIVKSGQVGWHEVKTPAVFWISTALIITSSITIQTALRSFKQRAMPAFRTLLLVTWGLGVGFVVLQCIGFNSLWNSGVHFEGSSGAGQFLYIIFGLHALHVLGGIVALTVVTARQYFGNLRSYDSTPVELMSTYWHFVDVLWIYLLVFFIWIG